MHHSHLPGAELSDATLANLRDAGLGAALPAYDRSRLAAGIAHIGVGNLHRVHQAVAIDRCLHLPDHEAWGICGIGLGDSPASRAKAAAYAAQDGLYTVTEFAGDGSASARVIGAMTHYLHAPADPLAVVQQLADPATRIVSLTITEGGYPIDADGRFTTDPASAAADFAAPCSAFGYIVAALSRRRISGAGGFTVLSCDNLRSNGDTARAAVLGLARAVAPELAEWIAASCTFPNSMVDRIAPSVDAGELPRLSRISGIADALPAVCESYSQWVVEDKFIAGRPDLAAAGVELRDDVHAFEAMKGRLLNASHSLLAYPALLMGVTTTPAAMAEPLLAGLLERFMAEDVIPVLEGPAGVSLPEYKNSLLQRFANPALADQVVRLAHDGASKIPVFCTDTIAALVAQGRDARGLAFLLACFHLYLRGVDEQGVAYTVREPSLTERDLLLLVDDDPAKLLDVTAFAGIAACVDEAFVAALRKVGADLKRDGVRAVLAGWGLSPNGACPRGCF